MEASQIEIGRWPNKISDYLASGRPIAATDVGDAGAFFRDTGCGMVSMPTLDEYCSMLLSVLDDAALLDRFGARARSGAENDLSWQTIAERFLEFVAAAPLKTRKRGCAMRKALSKLALAAYTIGVIVVEGIYLLLAWAAIKLGWAPKKKER